MTFNTSPNIGHDVQTPGLMALAASGTHPGWIVLDAARDGLFTGEIAFPETPEIRAYFDNGVAYHAVRAGDSTMCERLLDAGIVEPSQLERGVVRVGNVAHLGRLFDRDPSIDRDAVMAMTEIATDSVLTDLANRSTSAFTVTPYRHHASGVHRWFVAPTDPMQLAPIGEVAQIDASVTHNLPGLPVAKRRDVDDLRIEWDQPITSTAPVATELPKPHVCDPSNGATAAGFDAPAWTPPTDVAWDTPSTPLLGLDEFVVSEAEPTALPDDPMLLDTFDDDFQIVWPDGTEQTLHSTDRAGDMLELSELPALQLDAAAEAGAASLPTPVADQMSADFGPPPFPDAAVPMMDVEAPMSDDDAPMPDVHMPTPDVDVPTPTADAVVQPGPDDTAPIQAATPMVIIPRDEVVPTVIAPEGAFAAEPRVTHPAAQFDDGQQFGAAAARNETAVMDTVADAATAPAESSSTIADDGVFRFEMPPLLVDNDESPAAEQPDEVVNAVRRALEAIEAASTRSTLLPSIETISLTDLDLLDFDLDLDERWQSDTDTDLPTMPPMSATTAASPAALSLDEVPVDDRPADDVPGSDALTRQLIPGEASLTAPAALTFAPPTIDTSVEAIYARVAEGEQAASTSRPEVNAAPAAGVASVVFVDDDEDPDGGDRSGALRRLIGSLRRK